MRILYLHQYFSTPNGTNVTRAYEFSKDWASSGHDVTVLTTTSHMVKDDLEHAKGFFIRRLELNDCKIIALRIPYNQGMGRFRRIAAWLAFLFISCFYVLFNRRYDLVWARSTPLVVGLPAMLAKRIRMIRYVFEVTDQWPEIPIEMGIIKNKALIRSLLWVEKVSYKYADMIVTCSSGMTKGVKKILRANSIEKKVETVPNFSETDIYSPEIDGNDIRIQNSWENKFVIIHAGTMGPANSLGFVLEVAKKLEDNEDLLFVLIGEGSEKSALEERIKELELRNVEIRPAIGREKLPQVLAAADALMVIFCDIPIIQDNSANKFFDALASGKPLLINYSGWQRDMIEKWDAGFGCSQGNVEEFVDNVKRLSGNPELKKRCEKRARELAEMEYSKEILIKKVRNIISHYEGVG